MSVCVIGSINLDIVTSVEALPRPGETVTASELSHYPGGKGANQAVASARMQVDTLMIGAVGKDDAGSFMQGVLHDSGIDTGAVATNQEKPTGQAFINVAASGENAIVIVPGANGALDIADLPDEIIREHKVFLAQLEVPVDAIRELFTRPAAKNGLTILNTAPAVKEADSLFDLVDVLIMNETELASYTGFEETVTDTASIASSARQLIKQSSRKVIVTLGARGSVLVERETEAFIEGHPVRAVDTTGAGDCFCGVLAAMLGEGRSISEALQMANKASSLSVQRPGAASSMPGRDEVLS